VVPRGRNGEGWHQAESMNWQLRMLGIGRQEKCPIVIVAITSFDLGLFPFPSFASLHDNDFLTTRL